LLCNTSALHSTASIASSSVGTVIVSSSSQGTIGSITGGGVSHPQPHPHCGIHFQFSQLYQEGQESQGSSGVVGSSGIGTIGGSTFLLCP